MGIPGYFKQILNYYQRFKTQVEEQDSSSSSSGQSNSRGFQEGKIDLIKEIVEWRNNNEVENLLLDSNSIIYDVNNGRLNAGFSGDEEQIITEVIEKIQRYIDLVRPTKRIYIAFDGVPPVAKLDQQRERRYRGVYRQEVTNDIGLLMDLGRQANNLDQDKLAEQKPLFDRALSGLEQVIPLESRPGNLDNLDLVRQLAGTPQADAFQYREPYNPTNRRQNTNFDTIAITAGTNFMTKLGKRLKQADVFVTNGATITVSTSDEPGEGEHKLFDYYRANAGISLVYGVDADLFMLAINNFTTWSKNIYLFREIPEQFEFVFRDLRFERGTPYLIDIPELFKIFAKKMNGGTEVDEKTDYYDSLSHDYVFMFMLLGNDFMPHLPSLDYRSHGSQKIFDAYNNMPKKTKNSTLTSSNGYDINWKNVILFVEELAKNEETFFYETNGKRTKFERELRGSGELSINNIINPKVLMNKYDRIPYLERDVENEILKDVPNNYYRILFDDDQFDTDKLCQNYAEALEWTMYYYTWGCKDWRWSYKYCYPPLMNTFNTYLKNRQSDKKFLVDKEKNYVDVKVSLAYVLPKQRLHYLPYPGLKEKLLTGHPEWYKDDCEFKWAFKQFFEESCVMLPEIDINEFEAFVLS
jgi:5'-3' exonuclease